MVDPELFAGATSGVNQALEITKSSGCTTGSRIADHIKVPRFPLTSPNEKAMLARLGGHASWRSASSTSMKMNRRPARSSDSRRQIGVQSISANPDKNEPTFKLLDKLVEEYGVNIAIHNHGPGAKYDKIDDGGQRRQRPPSANRRLSSTRGIIFGAKRTRSRRSSAERSRVRRSHERCQRRQGLQSPGGRRSRRSGCLKVLQKIKYKYCLALEYEENPKNPVPDLELLPGEHAAGDDEAELKLIRRESTGPLFGAGLPTPRFGAESPDPADKPDRRSPARRKTVRSSGDLRSNQWLGQETGPQLKETGPQLRETGRN